MKKLPILHTVSTFYAGSGRAAAIRTRKCPSTCTLPLYPAPKARVGHSHAPPRTAPDSTGQRAQAPAHPSHRPPPMFIPLGYYNQGLLMMFPRESIATSLPSGSVAYAQPGRQSALIHLNSNGIKTFSFPSITPYFPSRAAT